MKKDIFYSVHRIFKLALTKSQIQERFKNLQTQISIWKIEILISSEIVNTYFIQSKNQARMQLFSAFLWFSIGWSGSDFCSAWSEFNAKEIMSTWYPKMILKVPKGWKIYVFHKDGNQNVTCHHLMCKFSS